MDADSSNSASTSSGQNALVRSYLNALRDDDRDSVSSLTSESGHPDDEHQLHHADIPGLPALDAVGVYVRSFRETEVSLAPFGDDDARSAQDRQSSASGSHGPQSAQDINFSPAGSSVHVVEEADRAVNTPGGISIPVHSSLSSQSVGTAAALDDNFNFIGEDDQQTQPDGEARNPYSDAHFEEWRIGRKSSLGLKIRLSAHEKSNKVYALLSHGHAHFLKIFRPFGELKLCRTISDITPATNAGKAFSISASDNFIVIHFQGYLSVYTLGLVRQARKALEDSSDILAMGDDVYVLQSRQEELIMSVFHVQENAPDSATNTRISFRKEIQLISFQKEIQLSLPVLGEATMSRIPSKEAILVGGVRGGKYIVYKLAFPTMHQLLRPLEMRLSGESIQYNICLSATGSDIIIVCSKPFIDIWRPDRLEPELRIDKQAHVQDMAVLDDRLVLAMDVNIQFTSLNHLLAPNDLPERIEFNRVNWERFTYFSEHEKRTIALSSSPENDDIYVFMQGGNIIGYKYPSCRLLGITCTGITANRVRMRMTNSGYFVIGLDDKVLLVDSGGTTVCTENIVATTLLDVGFWGGHVFVLTTNEVIYFLLHVRTCPTDSNISSNVPEVNVELKPRGNITLPVTIERGFMFLTETHLVALTDKGAVKIAMERPRSNSVVSLMDQHVAAPSAGGPAKAPSVGGHAVAPSGEGYVGSASVGGNVAVPSAAGPITSPSLGGHLAAPPTGEHVASPSVSGHLASPSVGGHVTNPVRTHMIHVATPSVSGHGHGAAPPVGEHVTSASVGGHSTSPSVEAAPPRGGRGAAPSVGGHVTSASVGGLHAGPSVGGHATAPSTGEHLATSVSGHGAAPSVGGHVTLASVSGLEAATSVGGHAAELFLDGPPAAPFVIDGDERLLVAGESGVDVYDDTWRHLLGTIRHVGEDIIISGSMITDMMLCHDRVIICYGQECYSAPPLIGGLDPDPDPNQSEDLDPQYP